MYLKQLNKKNYLKLLYFYNVSFKRLVNLLLTIRQMLLPQKIISYDLYLKNFKGKIGLEIGGPSDIFKKHGLIPIYTVINKLDGCNFSSKTIWEGDVQEGPSKYLYEKHCSKGYQYINDAVDLKDIPLENYDFLLASHCIEHIANPFRAIYEWLRVLKPNGHLLMVVPHRDGTFDHKRPITKLQHLIDDFNKSITEDDLSHLQEILNLHDLKLDPGTVNVNYFRQRSIKNYENRCLHHHVFDTDLVIRIADYFNLQILDIQTVLPFHIILLASKISGINNPDNSIFLSKLANYKYISPFLSDTFCQ